MVLSRCYGSKHTYDCRRSGITVAHVTTDIIDCAAECDHVDGDGDAPDDGDDDGEHDANCANREEDGDFYMFMMTVMRMAWGRGDDTDYRSIRTTMALLTTGSLHLAHDICSGTHGSDDSIVVYMGNNNNYYYSYNNNNNYYYYY